MRFVEATNSDRHGTVESLMWDVAARVLVLGVDVVLDFGCWVKSQRDEFRSKAHELGAKFQIHFTNVSEEMLIERLKIRNSNLPDETFYIPERKLKRWMSLFEPPYRKKLDL